MENDRTIEKRVPGLNDSSTDYPGDLYNDALEWDSLRKRDQNIGPMSDTSQRPSDTDYEYVDKNNPAFSETIGSEENIQMMEDDDEYDDFELLNFDEDEDDDEDGF